MLLVCPGSDVCVVGTVQKINRESLSFHCLSNLDIGKNDNIHTGRLKSLFQSGEWYVYPEPVQFEA